MMSWVFKISLLFGLTACLSAQALFQGFDHPVNARGWAMGAAVSSLSREGTGLSANPAVIGRTQSVAQINYTNYVLDIYATNVYSVFETSKGRLATMFRYLSYGSFTERDGEGNYINEFSIEDMYMSLGYGNKILKKIYFGAMAGYTYSHFQTLSARALTFSTGLLYYDAQSTLAVGLAYLGFGKQLAGYLSPETLNRAICTGISKDLAHLPMIIALDLVWDMNVKEYIIKLGGEFIFNDRFYLRWGSSTKRFQLATQQNLSNFLAGSSCGIGLRKADMVFDIALVGLGDFGEITSISIHKSIE